MADASRIPPMKFTPALRDELRRDYEDAQRQGREVFSFYGQPVLVSYARYLLEYLDMKFPHHPQPRTPL